MVHHGRGKWVSFRPRSTNQHGDMEHFRPKGKVTDLSDQSIRIQDDDGHEKEHPGYYWLAYDWENLLPSCQLCNQPSKDLDSATGQTVKLGKRSRFPLTSGSRYTWHPDHDLSAESPVFINPVQEDPAEHLEVDLETGLMSSKTARGRVCIDVFGLNLRDGLPEGRRNAMLAVQAVLVQLVHETTDLERQQLCINRLMQIRGGSEPYTLAARALLDSHLASLAPLSPGNDDST